MEGFVNSVVITMFMCVFVFMCVCVLISQRDVMLGYGYVMLWLNKVMLGFVIYGLVQLGSVI